MYTPFFYCVDRDRNELRRFPTGLKRQQNDDMMIDRCARLLSVCCAQYPYPVLDAPSNAWRSATEYLPDPTARLSNEISGG